jgi:hypothetical protein
MADKLSEELLKYLGMQDLECLLAERRTIAAQGASQVPLANGYLALVNCAESGKLDAASLRVRDGRLIDARGAQEKPLSDFDYCLVRIERLDSRNDYTALGFHKTWQSARERLVQNRPDEARVLMAECIQQIFASADLTEAHKYRLQQVYWANFQRDQDMFAQRAQPIAARGTSTRGLGGSLLTGSLAISRLRSLAEKADAPRAGIQALAQMEQTWQVLKLDASANYVLDDGEINRQLRLLSAAPVKHAPDPAALLPTFVRTMLGGEDRHIARPS